jgi:1,4-alpha-glucan branching enzyme
MAKKSTKKTAKQGSVLPMAATRGKAGVVRSAEPDREQTPATKAVSTPGQAPAAAVPGTREVLFALLDPDAKQVWLSGEFNGWAADATPMNRRQGGQWESVVKLACGRYEYKFVVDGQWLPDPMAAENVLNAHGTLNSVIHVKD